MSEEFKEFICWAAIWFCTMYAFINEEVNFLGIYFIDFREFFLVGAIICWLIVVYIYITDNKKKK